VFGPNCLLTLIVCFSVYADQSIPLLTRVDDIGRRPIACFVGRSDSVGFPP
jgi:hypothetical protein